MACLPVWVQGAASRGERGVWQQRSAPATARGGPVGMRRSGLAGGCHKAGPEPSVACPFAVCLPRALHLWAWTTWVVLMATGDCWRAGITSRRAAGGPFGRSLVCPAQRAAWPLPVLVLRPGHLATSLGRGMAAVPSALHTHPPASPPSFFSLSLSSPARDTLAVTLFRRRGCDHGPSSPAACRPSCTDRPPVHRFWCPLPPQAVLAGMGEASHSRPDLHW